MGGGKMSPFATIKKLPRQRTLTREGNYIIGCKRNANIAAILASSLRSSDVTSTTSLTIHHLLSVESGKSLQRLLPDSVFACENMPPRKKAYPVYTGDTP
jgi:hypothetical protein